jgi:hypothetical protein
MISTRGSAPIPRRLASGSCKIFSFYPIIDWGCIALPIHRRLNVDPSRWWGCCCVPQLWYLWSNHLRRSHHLSKWWHCLCLILVITPLMVRVSIVHHHLQDIATQQMLQMGRSRLRLLRSERHVAVDIVIDMSSSEFFGGAKLIFCASIHSSRWLWNGVLDGYDHKHLDLNYFGFKGLSSTLGTHRFLLQVIACPHRHDATTAVG